MKEKIIEHMKETGEWGEFFPPFVSEFAYNETAAQDLFPLTKEEVIASGYKWKDSEEKNYTVTMKQENIPDTIQTISDSIITEVIECAHGGSCNHRCTTAFKVVSDELNLYKKLNIPIPHLCPNCRHFERISRRNPINLWHRSCMNDGCKNEFDTSYAPNRPEIIYCESCYQQEVN